MKYPHDLLFSPEFNAWIETEGFHQHIHMNISTKSQVEKCHQFVVLQVVTQDMFADLDQLQVCSIFNSNSTYLI